MTIQLASAIVSQIGPCRIALDVPGFPALQTELALLGCAIGGGDANAVVVEQTGGDALDWQSTLAPYGSARALVILSHGLHAAPVEAAVFAAGWRRLPGSLNPSVLAQLRQGSLPDVSFYERAPQDYAGLLNLSDEESIGWIARWGMASDRIRPGDHVLLCGPHADDGRAIIGALSRAGTVRAAQDGADHGAARSVDMVVALDPPGAWDANIENYARLLKLDGRLIVGWPENSGRGPESWLALDERLQADFLIESRFSEGVGQALPQPVPLGAGSLPGWQIAIAAVNPIGGEAERESYVHPAFGLSKATFVDFGTGYDNPWLYRVMVQMGERLSDDTKLMRLAEYVARHARAGSADQGAALAVLGYRVLENRADSVVPMLVKAITAYYDRGGAEPQIVRWRISLAFLAGRLAELTGDREAAKLWYARAAGDDWQHFASILATKAVGAAFFVGRLLLAEGDQAAWGWFQRGVDTALRAAGADHSQDLGAGEGLLPFYLPELAEVIDMGSQCANALASKHLWERNPGLFWRQVDVKRFGLASWAIDVARENARLRQRAQG